MNNVLITGALGGIGQALCAEFKNIGCRVIAVDKDIGSCECDEFIQSDITEIVNHENQSDSSILKLKRLVAECGLFCLVNNAAVQILSSTDDINLEDWHTTLNTNLLAPFFLTKYFLPELEKAEGTVVNIGSIHSIATKPKFVCYATSKSALVGLTKSMAVDLGPRIRINAINPAATATPMLLAGFEGKQKEFDELAKMHPIERIADPHEIAKSAVFLSSKNSSFITGSCLNIDGGMSSRLHDPA